MKKSDLAKLIALRETMVTKNRNGVLFVKDKYLKNGKFAECECHLIEAIKHTFDNEITRAVDGLLETAIAKLQAIEKEERGW